MICLCGPAHGGPVVVGNTYLKGNYSEIYPNISQDEAGLRKLFLQFFFPEGIPSETGLSSPANDFGCALGASAHFEPARRDRELLPLQPRQRPAND